jgi:hypothetical protein
MQTFLISRFTLKQYLCSSHDLCDQYLPDISTHSMSNLKYGRVTRPYASVVHGASPSGWNFSALQRIISVNYPRRKVRIV